MARTSPRLAALLALTLATACLGGRSMPQDARAAGYVAAPSTAGALPVGKARYPVPTSAVFAAPSGRDTARGGARSPVRTIARAIAVAHNGGTVVLRAGTYHESVKLPAGKRLTLQAYPGEAVWLDGSSTVSGWRKAGGTWVHDGWTAQFDASPTYTTGAKPSGNPSFQFVGPDHPMAAHPDQVWLDGVAQRQVNGHVTAGTFAVDYAAHRLILGSNPAGHRVAASDLAQGVTVASKGSVVRGLGVRRYATSLPQLATVKAIAPNVTLENLVVTDSATTGVSALATHDTLRHVTAERSGMLGIHANYADDLRMLAVRSEHNNTEHFKYAPVAGGIKITRSRHVEVRDSVVVDNAGTGIWLDESVYAATLTGDDVLRNAHHGISMEISANGLIADNVVSGNHDDDVRLNNTSGVRLWNNTITGGRRGVYLVQDGRDGAKLTMAGHDPRQHLPDPTMTWQAGHVVIGDNVLTGASACLICVEDTTHRRSVRQMDVTATGNSYSGGRFVWGTTTYGSADAFHRGTGQAASAAAPLPRDIAAAVGRRTGTRHVGAWR